MFGTKKLSSYELDRLNVLGDMISAILITGRSELSHLARGVSAENQFASRVMYLPQYTGQINNIPS